MCVYVRACMCVRVKYCVFNRIGTWRMTSPFSFPWEIASVVESFVKSNRCLEQFLLRGRGGRGEKVKTVHVSLFFLKGLKYV